MVRVPSPSAATMARCSPTSRRPARSRPARRWTRPPAPTLPAYRRAEILREAAHRISARTADFADTICAEAGKPITAARAEVGRAVETFGLAAEEARRLTGEAVPMDAVASGTGLLSFTIPQPLGVLAAVTPFNFPLNLVAHKVGPALAAGLPGTAQAVGEDTAHGWAAGGGAGRMRAARRLVQPSDRGSSGGRRGMAGRPAGRRAHLHRLGVRGLAANAASPGKRHILELGSNTALYVAADADLGAAVQAAVAAAFGYSGQACVSLQRVYAARRSPRLHQPAGPRS